MKHNKLSLQIILVKYSRVILAIALCVIFAILSPTFLSGSNFYTIIAYQMPYLALMSFGMTMAIITLGIDLSIGSNMAFTACITGLLLKDGVPIFLCVVLALLVGCGIGMLNGFLITKIHMPPFITTYGIDWVVKGLAYVIMGGGTVFGFSETFRRVFNGKVLNLPVGLWAMILVTVFLFILLNKSTFGRNFYSMGMNIKATKLSGIKTSRILIYIYGMSGFLAGLTGLLYMARLNVAEGAMAENWSMQLMAATLIGGTPMTGGKGGVLQTLLGVFIMTVLTNGLNSLNISSLWQQVAVGCAIILSIFLEELGNIYTKRKK